MAVGLVCFVLLVVSISHLANVYCMTPKELEAAAAARAERDSDFDSDSDPEDENAQPAPHSFRREAAGGGL